MFQKLYRWTLSLAESQHAPWALGVIAFAESSFFPVPPDAILIPMSLARPKSAWVYALICTIGSVAGALLGYAIGALLFETVGKWLINLYGYGARVDELRALYAQWGWAVILFKGLTPIPFKIVTITSGLLAYSLPLFITLVFPHARRAVFLHRRAAQALWRADQRPARQIFRLVSGDPCGLRLSSASGSPRV